MSKDVTPSRLWRTLVRGALSLRRSTEDLNAEHFNEDVDSVRRFAVHSSARLLAHGMFTRLM